MVCRSRGGRVVKHTTFVIIKGGGRIETAANGAIIHDLVLHLPHTVGYLIRVDWALVDAPVAIQNIFFVVAFKDAFDPRARRITRARARAVDSAVTASITHYAVCPMDRLPQDDPDLPTSAPRQTSCTRRAFGALCLCCGCALLALTVWSAVASRAPPVNRLHNFECVGCTGECPGGNACNKCACMMAPLGCDQDDPESECWDMTYTKPLVAVEASNALCGVSVPGCGLPRD